MPLSYGYLAEHFELVSTDYDGLAEVAVKEPDEIKKLLNGPHDDVHSLFCPLYRDALSQHKTVYADTESWERIVEQQEVSRKTRDKNSVYFLSMLRPSALDGTILLGANIQDSLLYHWFGLQGASFEEEKRIAKKLCPLDPPGDRARISYFNPGGYFSKALAAKVDAEGTTFIDKMDALAVEAFGRRGPLPPPS